MNDLTKSLIIPFLNESLSNYIIYFDIDDTLSNYYKNLKKFFCFFFTELISGVNKH